MEENKMIENKMKEFNRYENSKIYKLIDQDSGYYYIGSTCGTLTQRLCRHKSVSKTNPERKVYKAYNEIGWENVKIILVQELYLDNKNELLRAENDVIMSSIYDDKCLNSKKAWTGLDRKEYKKKYTVENKEIKQEYDKQYYENHKEQKIKYIKQWQLEHKEQRKDYNKIRNHISVQCCCGSTYMCIDHKNRHESSKKHQTWLKDQTQTAETI